MKRKNWYLNLFAGILLVFASLVKQNFVVVVILLLIFEIWRAIKFKAQRPKTSLEFIGSILASYVLFCVYLFLNNNFSNFFESMLTGGGKVINGISLFTNLFAGLGQNHYSLFFLLVVFSSLSVVYFKPENTKFKIESLIYSGLLTIAIFFAFQNGVIADGKFQLLLLATSFVLILISWFIFQTHNDYIFFVISLISTIIVISTSIWIISNIEYGFIKRIWNGTLNLYSGFSTANIVLGDIIWIVVVGTISTRFLIYITNKSLFSKYLRKTNFKWEPVTPFFSNKIYGNAHPKNEIVVLFALLASGIINGFNGPIALNSNIVLATLVISWLYSRLRKIFLQAFNTAISILLILAIPVIPIHVYTWFGWDEFKTKNVTNEIPLFRNFNLTTEESLFYSELKFKLENVENNLLTFDSATIATIPSQPILGSLSNLNTFWLRCPVMHIDICPEKDALQDLNSISNGDPTVVIYYALPENLRKSFDDQYRKGNTSASNKILNTLRNSGIYELADLVVVPNFPETYVEIYVLKNQKKLE